MPFIPHVCAAFINVSLVMSSAISISSNPKYLQRTETIFLYSVLNKCGINCLSSIESLKRGREIIRSNFCLNFYCVRYTKNDVLQRCYEKSKARIHKRRNYERETFGVC